VETVPVRTASSQIRKLHQIEPQVQYSMCWYVLSPTRNETSYIPRILWNLEVHYHIHNSPPPVPNVAKLIHSSAHHTFDRRSLFLSWSG